MIHKEGSNDHIIVPASLKLGDKIGIVCPAGYMDPARMQDCVNALAKWGLDVVKGATFYSKSSNYFAGTDAERCQELQQMLDNPAIKAIICGRGGYGISRIIDQLNFNQFVKYPKWIIGFSDITLLHNHILKNCGISTIHGPMASAFIDFVANPIAEPGSMDFTLPSSATKATSRNTSILALKNALFNHSYQYTVPAHQMNRLGQCTAPIVGGNLSLLVHAMGSNSDISWENKILFIEDIGEYYYALDRMLLQLLRAGKLSKLAGLIVGGFSDIKDTLRPFGQSVEALIQDKLKDFDYPVCYGFPISHDDANLSIKYGIEHYLRIDGKAVTLKC